MLKIKMSIYRVVPLEYEAISNSISIDFKL